MFKRPDVSPLAITCRLTPNLMLGGHDEFLAMSKVAEESKVRIIIDAVMRVSSSRHHNKYRKSIVHKLNE